VEHAAPAEVRRVFFWPEGQRAGTEAGTVCVYLMQTYDYGGF